MHFLPDVSILSVYILLALKSFLKVNYLLMIFTQNFRTLIHKSKMLADFRRVQENLHVNFRKNHLKTEKLNEHLTRIQVFHFQKITLQNKRNRLKTISNMQCIKYQHARTNNYITAIIHATQNFLKNLNYILKSSKKHKYFFLDRRKKKTLNKIINTSMKDHQS